MLPMLLITLNLLTTDGARLMNAQLKDAVTFAIKNQSLTPDQWNAINWLSNNLTETQSIEFTKRWRSNSLTPAKVALPLVQEFEGCHLTAYPDPETNNEPWTIGWGTTVYSDGTKVKRGDKISQSLADELLLQRLQKDELLLSKRVPNWSFMTINQRAALISFTYNCGSNWFGSNGFNSLTKVITERNYSKVPEVLMLYVNPGGPTEAGLRRRRKAEGDLFKR